jgi:hypothetical protein
LRRNDRDALGCLKPGERVAVPRTGASAQGLAGPDLFCGTRQGFGFSAKVTRLIGQEVRLGLQFDGAILGGSGRRLHRVHQGLSRQGATGGTQASFCGRHLARQRLGLCHLVTQKVVSAHAAPASLERGDFSVDPVQIGAQSLIFGCETLG